MKVPFVDLKTQYYSIKDEITQAIDNVINDTAFIGGTYAKKFEEEFANFCRSKYCVGLGNGTDALHVAMRALGIGHGDEVITPANSFIASSEAITMARAKVVFVDCNPDTYNIDVQKIQSVITERTKAILPVHLYGQPADMYALKNIAKKHKLFIIEDCAQAHGAEINGQRCGTFGDIACYSFYPGKNLGAYGDAGAITTNSEELATKCRMIANHGRVKKYDHDFEGVNSRLDGLQGAILSVKLKFLKDWTDKRRTVAGLYAEYLKDCEIVIPVVMDGVRHVYHLYVIRVKDREAVQSALKERGIATGIHYPIALPNLQAYKYLGYNFDDFPVATKYSKEILSLPIYPELQKNQIEYVCEHLIKASQ